LAKLPKISYIHQQGWKFDVPFQISEMQREALPEAAKPAKVETEPEEFGMGNPGLTWPNSEGCESRLGLESPNPLG